MFCLGFFWVLFRKNDWVVFVFRAEYLDFPELHRKRITYYRMSLQGESQTHYWKKYLHHITVCKLIVQGATHVVRRKKKSQTKKALKYLSKKRNRNPVRPPCNRNPSSSNKTLKNLFYENRSGQKCDKISELPSPYSALRDGQNYSLVHVKTAQYTNER